MPDVDVSDPDPPPANEDTVVCEVRAVAPCDMRTIDLLARLALSARREGRRLVVRGAPEELRQLVELAGMAEVLPCPPDSGVEPER